MVGTVSESRIRVGVLYGGTSSEHSISCVSAGSVLRALDPQRFEVVRIGIDRQGTWRLDDQDTDLLPDWAPSFRKSSAGLRCR